MKQWCLLMLVICLSLATLGFATAQKVTRIYNVSHTDTASNYTLVVEPAKGKPAGLMLLMPGFGERPSDVLKETGFPVQAAQAGYLVAIPYIRNNATLLLSTASQKLLTQLTQDLQQRYQLKNRKMAVGGFSMGGTTAVKFAEYALSTPAAGAPQVAALFAVDPLLDLERFERSLLKAVQRRRSAPMPKRQLQMLQRMLQQEFDVTPIQAPEKYYSISPYAYNDTANAAIKPLQNLPVLFYSEPDIETQFNTNQRDLYELNAADCTAMITDLQSMGNQQAQLILTSGKGVRKMDNKPNPHAWSILDTGKTISWLQQHLK